MTTQSQPCCAPARPPGDGEEAASTPVARAIPVEEDTAAAARLRRGMVHLSGGAFAMGTEDGDANPGDSEGPVRTVTVEPFLVSPTTVTNAQFAVFAKRTGYRTTAERLGWSYVFHGYVTVEGRASVRGRSPGAPWWIGVDGADWRHPEGPGSGITDRQNHPVVHLSHDDCLAYCAWVGARLPTEAEWEFAARGGLRRARYPWGDELTPRGWHMCNIWQGRFPRHDTAEDGYTGTCPVTAFRPNAYGLYNMAGNVWEWSADHWSGGGLDDEYAMRGGSHLCHASYCNRYRVAARTRNTADSSSGNLGMRCVADPTP